ncbi:MAG: protoglobin domain-containing protein [Nitrospiria bacterium]
MVPEQDLMKELGIDMEEIRRRMSFIGLSEEEVRLLSGMEAFAEGHADRIVAAFYQHLLAYKETRAFLRDQATVDRLLKSQKAYLLEIFSGKFDKAYFERRLQTGAVHHRIGLEPKWYIATYSFYENLISQLISSAYQDEPDKGLSRDLAVRKIFRIDMVLALEFYFHSYFLEMKTRLDENIKEMDDFTRMVSHDLKEPLRGIEAFSSFLLEDYTALLDEKGKQYLNFLRESAVRMKELIHDLLTLVSLSRKGPNFEDVNLNSLLAEVKHDLEFSIQQKRAEVQCLSSLPTLYCDPIQIGEVFKNLLSNAIKFNTKTPPRVEFGVREEKASYIFSCKDNGIGIDPRYIEQIFRPFERLHPQDEFEGTGVGLAICKKVIEGYGGKIWIESEEGAGSIFFFTLPRKPEKRRNEATGLSKTP